MLHGLSEQSSHGTDEEACVGYKHQVWQPSYVVTFPGILLVTFSNWFHIVDLPLHCTPITCWYVCIGSYVGAVHLYS